MKFINTINKKNKCLRCGKLYARLSSHLNNKKLCNATYLDIKPSEMLNNYLNFYNQFLELEYKNSYICQNCEKIYKYQSGLSRHKKSCKNENKNKKKNIQVTNSSPNINNINLHTDSINIDASDNRIANVSLQQFGNEIYPQIDHILKYIENIYHTDNLENSYNLFLKLLFENPANRNIFLTDTNHGSGKIYKGNEKWENVDLQTLRSALGRNVPAMLSYILTSLENIFSSDNEIYDQLKRISIGCKALIHQQYNEKQIGSQLLNEVVNNKDILRNTMIESEKKNNIITLQKGQDLFDDEIKLYQKNIHVKNNIKNDIEDHNENNYIDIQYFEKLAEITKEYNENCKKNLGELIITHTGSKILTALNIVYNENEDKFDELTSLDGNFDLYYIYEEIQDFINKNFDKKIKII